MLCVVSKRISSRVSSFRGSTWTIETHLHFHGYDHASEMFGFVKDVFMPCAKGRGVEILMTEVYYVRTIFRGSEDSKDKELQNRAEKMIGKLENKMVLPSEASNCFFGFSSVGVMM